MLAGTTFAQFVTVTSQSIYGGSGQTLLSLGQIQFQAVDVNGNPINYQVGGGGQQLNYPTVCTVTNGAIQAACYVANVSQTNPLNVCFSITVKDANNNVVLGGGQSSGYQCAQPGATVTGQAWCSVSAGVTTCNFDKFIPNINGVPIVALPLPTTLTLGGIYAGDCPTNYVSIGYGILNPGTGLPDCIVSTGTGGLAVWGGITGILSNQTDLTAALALKAPLNSANLTGAPTVPTPLLTDNSQTIVNSAYVQGQNYAPLASPAFTGTPTAPTPPTSDSSIRIATTQWVLQQGYGTATGNVTGPVSSVVGDATIFNSTNGKAINDAGFGYPLAATHIGTLSAGANGLANSATTDTTSASNISSGTLNSARLAASGVAPGAYTNANITVDVAGRVTVAANGTSSGTPGGSNLQLQWNNSGAFAGFTLSGDCTLVPSTGVITCTKTNNVAFAASATTDTTNATNISSGTLNALRFPASGVTAGAYTSANITIDATGRVTTAANGAGVSGPGSSVVGHLAGFNNIGGTLLQDLGAPAASAFTDTTNATNIGSGTLPAGRLPAFTGDVTSPSGSSVNTVAANAVTNAKLAQGAANTLKGNNTSGTANEADLTTSQVDTLLGLAASAFTDTTNASNIASGTLNVSRLPPSGATAGSYTTANIMVNAAGQVTAASNGTAGTGNVNGPSISVVSNVALFNNGTGTLLKDGGPLAASATTDTTNATNISSGTLAAARLAASGAAAGSYTNPNVTIDVAGRVTNITSGSSGTPGGSSGQLQYNLSGAFAGYTMSGDGTLVPSTGVLTVTKTNGVAFAPSATTDTTNAANIASGTIPSARIGSNSITNTNLAQMATLTLKGNNVGGTANAADLTATQVNTLLGLAPSATTDTTNATNITSGTLPAARIPATAVSAGSYTSANITVGADGRLTSAASGTGGAGPGGTSGQLQVNVGGTSFGGVTISQDATVNSSGVLTNAGSSATSFYLPVGTATAPGAYLTNTSRLGLYGATVSNAWTVTSCTAASGTATCTVSNTSGFPFSFHANDYILTSAIGGGYDCSAPSPCLLTAVSSGSSTISYTSAGTGTRTSGTVNLFALGIHGQKTLFDSFHSTSANAANQGSFQLGPSDSIYSHDVTNNYDTLLLTKNTNAAVADTRAAQIGDTTYGATTAANAPFNVGGLLSVQGLINPMTSQGDLLSVNSSLGLTRIPVGSNGSLMFANAGLPGYTSCVQFTGTQLNICVPISVTQILVNGPLAWGSPLPPSTISTVGAWPTSLCTSFPCSGYITQANGGLSPFYFATSTASSILGNFLYDPGCTSGQVVTVATAATSTTPTVPGCASATGNMTGAASSITGDVISFADTTGKVAADSGVVAANVVTNSTSGTTNNGAKWSGTHTVSNTVWTETGNGLQPKENVDLQTNNAITQETTTAAGSYTAGLAGCFTASATLGNCATVAAALESPGVLTAKNGTAPQWASHGQVNVTSHSSAVWTFNDYVCSDSTNAAYYVDNGSTPCPNGQITIGQVDVTDGATATSHSVELNSTAGQTQAAGSGTIAAHTYLGNNTASTTSVGPVLIGASDTGPNLTATDTGAANAYAICPTPAVTALTAGTTVLLTPANANTGSSTVNVCSLGVKSITKYGTNAIASGDLVTTATYPITYDGTEWTLTSNQTGCPNCANFTGAKTANGVTYTPNTGNQLASSAGITMDSGHNFFNKYNNVATAGTGVATVYGASLLTGQTAGTGGVTLCSTTCPTGQYQIDAYINASGTSCGTPGPAAVQLSVTYTDDVGTKTGIVIPIISGSALGSTLPIGNTSLAGDGHKTLKSVTGNIIQYAVTYTACTTGTAVFGISITATRTQ